MSNSFMGGFSDSLKLGMGIAEFKDRRQQQALSNDLAMREEHRRAVQHENSNAQHFQNMEYGDLRNQSTQLDVDLKTATFDDNVAHTAAQRAAAESNAITAANTARHSTATTQSRIDADLEVNAANRQLGINSRVQAEAEAALGVPTLNAQVGAETAQANIYAQQLAAQKSRVDLAVARMSESGTMDAARIDVIKPYVERAFSMGKGADGMFDATSLLTTATGQRYLSQLASHAGEAYGLTPDRVPIAAYLTEDGKGVVFEIDNKTTGTQGPMTENGTNDPKDNVVIIPIEELNAEVQALGQITGLSRSKAQEEAWGTAVEQHPEAQQIATAQADTQAEIKHTTSAIEQTETRIPKIQEEVATLEPEYQRVMQERSAIEGRIQELEAFVGGKNVDPVTGETTYPEGYAPGETGTVTVGRARTRQSGAPQSARQELAQLRRQLTSFDNSGNNKGIISRFEEASGKLKTEETRLQTLQGRLKNNQQMSERIREVEQAYVEFANMGAVTDGDVDAIKNMYKPAPERTAGEVTAAASFAKDQFKKSVSALILRSNNRARGIDIDGAMAEITDALLTDVGQEVLAARGVSPYVLTKPGESDAIDVLNLSKIIMNNMYYDSKAKKWVVSLERGLNDPE